MNELTITRGDTLETALVIYTDDTQQEEYIPAEGDVIRFAVKRKISDAEPIITQIINNTTLALRVEAEQTKLLPNPSRIGKVIQCAYDVQITHPDGTVEADIKEVILEGTPEVD